MLHAQTGTNAIFTSCAHLGGHIDEAPPHFPRAKHTHHMEQRALDRVEPRVVCPFSCRCCAFGVDSTDRCFGVVRVFFDTVRMNGSDAPDACGVFFLIFHVATVGIV